ncbi:MAG: hypothetical protein L6263_10565, partial [Desulfobacteraceae bacterium]|nr:hypothetical protein [Desulfobacteraceae bacterium]
LRARKAVIFPEGILGVVYCFIASLGLIRCRQWIKAVEPPQYDFLNRPSTICRTYGAGQGAKALRFFCFFLIGTNDLKKRHKC